jgi:hypothetical protein
MVENLDDTGNGGKLNEPLHGSVILDAWLFDMSVKLKCIVLSVILDAWLFDMSVKLKCIVLSFTLPAL